jgi:hypothetical protein
MWTLGFGKKDLAKWQLSQLDKIAKWQFELCDSPK